MKYQVYFIYDAEEDIFDIYKYALTNDGAQRADYLFEKLKATCQSLDMMPERGHIPPELERIGVYDFLEIHFKPYRIIYQIKEKKVFVHCVLDGRRDLQELLQQRLLR